MARKGYVVASIDYRVGAPNKSMEELGHVIVRSVQDLNSFIRYSKANDQTLGIDTNLIFLSGNSAGGIACIFQQYVDLNEYPIYIDVSSLGPPSGLGNLNGKSTKVAGVYNMWGLVNDTNWIQSGDPPIGGIQSKYDPCVPFNYSAYSCAVFSLPSFGSNSIYLRAQHLGLYSSVYAFQSNLHNIGLDTLRYIDTTTTQMAAFCYHVIHTIKGPEDSTALYACPNPFHDSLFISGIGKDAYVILDAKNHKVKSGNVNGAVNTAALPAGVYRVVRKGKETRAELTVRKE
jgi:hypothetical protein